MCGTCHSFLFAVDGEEQRQTEIPEDDEDSGNDEPPYAAGVNPSHSNANVANAGLGEAVGADENMEEDDEDDNEVPEDMIEIEANVPVPNELPLVRPRPSPPRNMLQYLDLLSTPRVNDRNDPILFGLCTEVLLNIFSYLDEFSLASVSRVCGRWRNIVQMYTNDQMWCQYTKKRFPLFQEIARIPNWMEVSVSFLICST